MTIAEVVTRAALIGMGVFTAVPVIAVFQPDQLGSSYGVVDPAPMTLMLLQHRGVFQLLAGAALVWAAFRPAVRVPVAVGVIISKGSALLLTVTKPEAQALANPFIQAFDVACIVVLVAIIVQRTVARRSTRRDPAQVAAMAP